MINDDGGDDGDDNKDDPAATGSDTTRLRVKLLIRNKGKEQAEKWISPGFPQTPI